MLHTCFLASSLSYLTRHIVVVNLGDDWILFKDVADELRCYTNLDIATVGRLWLWIHHLSRTPSLLRLRQPLDFQ
jgi:hypothetical protein